MSLLRPCFQLSVMSSWPKAQRFNEFYSMGETFTLVVTTLSNTIDDLKLQVQGEAGIPIPPDEQRLAFDNMIRCRRTAC